MALDLATKSADPDQKATSQIYSLLSGQTVRMHAFDPLQHFLTALDKQLDAKLAGKLRFYAVYQFY